MHRDHGMILFADNRAPRAMVLVAVSSLVASGCSSPVAPLKQVHAWVSDGWAADYEQAERYAEQSRRPMALYFKAGDKPGKNPAYRALRSPRVSARLSGYVHGTLARPHEPDRRYAAQFGVERAPALILVHTDGTYHALTGILNADTLAAFVDGADPPGAIPTYNPLIPRAHRYRWIDDLGVARSRCVQFDRPMMVAYARRLTGDWGKLSDMLDTHEVWIRAAGLIHCRQLLIPRFQDTFISPWGPIRLPALLVVLPDGRHDVLELPDSSEQAARFVDAALRGEALDPAAEDTAAGAAPVLP